MIKEQRSYYSIKSTIPTFLNSNGLPEAFLGSSVYVCLKFLTVASETACPYSAENLFTADLFSLF